jgi:putative peptidoglycan lipid II flippase
LRYAVVHVVLAVALGYLFAIPLPNALGIDLRWGAVGLTTAAGLGGWAEFLLLRRKLNNRIGRTGLPLPFIAKLWTAAIVAAAIGWAIKLFIGVERPILTALAVLGPFGLSYFLLTSLFGLPEANRIVGRFTKLLRRGRN